MEKPLVWLDFNASGIEEVHLGLVGTRMSIEQQQLELSEGQAIVVFDDDDPDEWMLADAVVGRYDTEEQRWNARVDWSSFRREPPGGRTGLHRK
jgi:hypothetical protein